MENGHLCRVFPENSGSFDSYVCFPEHKSHSIPTNPTFSHGFPWFSTVFLWFSHGFPRFSYGFPWFSTVFLWGFTIKRCPARSQRPVEPKGVGLCLRGQGWGIAQGTTPQSFAVRPRHGQVIVYSDAYMYIHTKNRSLNYVCIYIYIYVSLYIYVSILYIYIHTYIHTYIHIV